MSQDGTEASADPQEQAGDPSKGDYEFMGANEGRAEGETQALAPATEDQAKALEPSDHPALPDQDTDDVMAAAEQETDEAMEDASQHTRPEQVLKGNAAGSQANAGLQEDPVTDNGTATGADTDAEPTEDSDMQDGEAARDWVDDSYVSAQLQRASLAEGGAGGVPNEDMVLAEGGLSHEAAEQLRKGVDMRIKAASEGTLQLDTSAKAATYGQEVQHELLSYFTGKRPCCELPHWVASSIKPHKQNLPLRVARSRNIFVSRIASAWALCCMHPCAF